MPSEKFGQTVDPFFEECTCHYKDRGWNQDYVALPALPGPGDGSGQAEDGSNRNRRWRRPGPGKHGRESLGDRLRAKEVVLSKMRVPALFGRVQPY